MTNYNNDLGAEMDVSGSISQNGHANEKVSDWEESSSQFIETEENVTMQE